MKRTKRQTKKLRVKKETVVTLNSSQLPDVRGGCDTTSWTTEAVAMSNRNC